MKNNNCCCGKEIPDMNKTTYFMKLEEKFPGFTNQWNEMRERICNSAFFEKKDDSALTIYCGIYVTYVQELCNDKRIGELSEYIYLLLMIQVKLRALHSTENEMTRIDNIGPSYIVEPAENEITALVASMSETIRRFWGRTKERVKSLRKKSNIEKLSVLHKAVLEEEKKFIFMLKQHTKNETDFSLNSTLMFLKNSFECYEKTLNEFEEMHKALTKEERKVVNSPENCVAMAKQYLAEESMSCPYVIFKNGTAVGGIEYSSDMEEIKKEARKKLIESKSEGKTQAFDYDKALSAGDCLKFLVQTPEMGGMNGIFNFFWETEKCYYNIDEEISNGHRHRDSEELEIVCVLYKGEQI